MEIGEKTNVYSLEVSMFGHEQKTDMNTPNLEPVHSYSEEDCKSTLMSVGLWSFKDGGS